MSALGQKRTFDITYVCLPIAANGWGELALADCDVHQTSPHHCVGTEIPMRDTLLRHKRKVPAHRLQAL